MDSARILKRFFFCEQALIVAQGGWLAAIPQLEVKWGLPRHLWEDSMAADALRERVFELHFPSRMMEVADDAPVVEIFQAAIDAPNAYAFVLSLERVFKPTLISVYQAYLDHADEIADGPSKRFLKVAVDEKQEQLRELRHFAEELAGLDEEGQAAAEAWVAALQTRLDLVGGLSLEEPHAAD